ncbi:MAG: Thermostable monoacylglycerol lipase [Acidobacteria bacterium]|nr:Thermostable monoacylglycerol lipase [Acidobacteriota bacterium]WKZ36282.1 MAG: alpha/beta fold hydrolase [Anaerolineales bacterium]
MDLKSLTMPGAEPFLFPGDSKRNGVLLIHGFTGSPAAMRGLGKYLNETQGYTTLGIRLPGHGTQVDDLRRPTWRDWLVAVEDGLNLLRGMSDRIYVAGLSMGGVLTLIAGNRYEVHGVAALSTPYGLTGDWRVRFMRPLSLFVPKFKKPAAVGNRAETSYAYFVPHAIAEAAELAKLMQTGLPKINVPVLLIQSHGDKVIEPNALDLLSERLVTPHKETLWLEKSGHVITLDQEREIVYRKVADFFTTRPKGF